MSFFLLEYNIELWYVLVGVFLVRNEVGIMDKEVLDVIVYYIFGRFGMMLFEKIVYVVDYIEFGRRFLGVDEVWELVKMDLNVVFI